MAPCQKWNEKYKMFIHILRKRNGSYKTSTAMLVYFYQTYFGIKLLSKPQLNHNHNSTQPNITLSWIRHENDFAHHPTPPSTPHTNSMLAISQLLLTYFDETLNVG